MTTDVRHESLPFTKAPIFQPGTRYQRFLLAALDKHLSGGRITFVMPGETRVVGNDQGGDELVVRVHDRDFFRKTVCYGNLGMGESYMAGDFEVEGERLTQLLTLLCRSQLDRKLKQDFRFAAYYLGVRVTNFLSSKATNVRRHYDIGDDLFDCFLEDTYQVYSCGYAHSWDDDIETLQSAKLDRICRKLALEPHHRLLDIGCGNGGLIVHAARHYGVRAMGVTNSRSHYQRTLANIRKHGLEDRVSVFLGDFTDVTGEFDRVSSVGMLEHVPPREYPAYFAKIKSVLRPHGWAMVHAIGFNAAKNEHDPFIQKYIFPGSDTPKLSAFATNIESLDLAIVDVENIARHYAPTCDRWLQSFRKNRDRLDPARYDDRFKRMWEYYLACGTAVALVGNLAVYQVLFTNDYHAPYRYQRV